MRRSFTLFALALLPAALGSPPELAAQTEISARAATLRVGGRLHAQYQASSIDAADNDFFIRRARINVDLEFNDFFSGKVLTDFAGGTATLLDAYVRLGFSDALNVSVGQMKRSFDLFELVSSTDLSIIERVGEVGGYDACTGVGSVCSYSQMIEELGYGGRDAGIKVDGASGTFGYQATVTNGTGVGVPDENDGKTLAGRGTLQASDNVMVSGNLSLRDYIDPMGETTGALAWGGDVQVGDWRDGFLLQAGIVGGENWMSLDLAGDPNQFLSFQAAASFYQPLDNDRFVGIEPLLRVSVTDPDDSLDDDGGTLFTPGVMFYLLGKNKIGVNLDLYSPQTGDAVYSFRFGTFLYF